MKKNKKRVSYIYRVSKMIIVCGLIPLVITCKSTHSQTSSTQKPNIVLIFLDDVGYGDIGDFGAIGYETPHLDKLSSQGMRFTNFYAQPVCSASRAALMTGSQPVRVRIGGAVFPHANFGLNPKEETIAELLKKQGYTTGIVGKWHLGDAKKFLPLQQGFDMYLGLPYSNDMWPKGHRNTKTSKVMAHMPPLPLIDGNKTVEYIRNYDQMDSLDLKYTKRAVRFINHHKDQPFFLYFAHNQAHVPLYVSDKFKGKSEQGMYGDVMEEIDWSVGQVMQALKRNGLAKNTLVIFTSDNGPWINFGKRGGSTAGLRGGKLLDFEGGVREPTIMRWPGVIPEGTINNKIAATIDILPTLAKITGARLPKQKIDGVNILPILKDPSNEDPRKHFFFYSDIGGKLNAVRKGAWKLILPHHYMAYEGESPGKGGAAGPRHQDSIKLSLYNMRRDRGERYNVAEQHPKVVKELMKLVKKERKELGDSNVGIKCSQCRPHGKITGKKTVYPSLENNGKGKKSKPINWSKYFNNIDIIF
jgi:arylsulfatase